MNLDGNLDPVDKIHDIEVNNDVISIRQLASFGMSRPVHLKQYESRFKQCLLTDVVHLEQADFNLRIPGKWKDYQ